MIEAQKKAIPKKTRQDTDYCIRLWEGWRESRIHQGYSIPSIHEMDPAGLSHWITKFVLEVQKVNGGVKYQPNTLYLRHVQNTLNANIDFFKDPEFAGFRGSLDAEMKRLQSKGLGSVHRQAEAITEDEEELLWEEKILGDHSPQSLLNTIIYMNDLYLLYAVGTSTEIYDTTHVRFKLLKNQVRSPTCCTQKIFLKTVQEESKVEK